MAANCDIEYYRGDSYPKTLTITDKATGNPVDLTGATLVMTVNKLKDPINTDDQLFQVNGVLDADPTTGKVSFTPTTVNTDQEKGKYYYDVEMTDPGGNKRTVVKAQFLINMDIGKE